MNDKLDYIDKLNSINFVNYYPFNLNDNIIETKKEVDLEYVKNFIFTDDKKINGKNEKAINIFVF